MLPGPQRKEPRGLGQHPQNSGTRQCQCQLSLCPTCGFLQSYTNERQTGWPRMLGRALPGGPASTWPSAMWPHPAASPVTTYGVARGMWQGAGFGLGGLWVLPLPVSVCWCFVSKSALGDSFCIPCHQEGKPHRGPGKKRDWSTGQGARVPRQQDRALRDKDFLCFLGQLSSK
jgi:hypothetical protein